MSQFYGHGRDGLQRPAGGQSVARGPPGMAGGMGQMGNRYGNMRGADSGAGSMASGRGVPTGRGPGDMMGARGRPQGAAGMMPPMAAGRPGGHMVPRTAGRGGGPMGGRRANSGPGGSGGRNDAGAGLAFDMNDFPSLGGSSKDARDMSNAGYRNAAAGATAARAPAEPQPFAMSSADFPALPQSGGRGSGSGGRKGGRGDAGVAGGARGRPPVSGFASAVASHPPKGDSAARAGAGHQHSAGMQQYGLLGMLHVIRMGNPDLTTLALGLDLTTLGLNLNSPECLYSTFASPWVDTPATKDPHFTLPSCYNMQPPALKTGHLQEFTLETLFYIFYTMPRDSLQAYAAQELYRREWRYHQELRLWFALLAPDKKQPGPQYAYFDIKTWEKRLFSGSIPGGLAAGFLPLADVQVKPA